MKYLKQLALLLGLVLVGEAITRLLPFAFPGSVMAMLLLTVLLGLGLIPENSIKETGDFFLGLLGLFVIPSSVAILETADVLLGSWWQILAICLVALVLSFGACATVIRLVTKGLKKGGKHHV
ncbi:MAG: CidA/LrgA family protein [Turicibacter sp.]|nr:CidA/LrgA family protein [Turicibacter sp.]